MITSTAEAPVRPGFVAHDPAFADVIGAAPRLEQVVATDAHEGPVYAADEDALYFTTVPRRPARPDEPVVAIKRIALDGARFPVDPGRVTVAHPEANVANGMTLDGEGMLVVCEQGTTSRPARITRIDRATGDRETLVDSWNGLPLNSPNDVVVKGDGTVWFTDPAYGHLQGFRPEPRVRDAVYRYDPGSGEVAVAALAFDKPNGLAFSPDERILYVGDNGAPHHLLAFGVGAGGSLTRPRIVAVGTPEHPDGVKVDRDGRIYTSAATGIQVWSPRGALAGEIVLPGAVNFTFGGPERNILFITRDTAVWAAVLNTREA